MRVALDTSVICADFHFRSTDARLLWDGLGKSITGIFIPAVVAEEVGTKHREALESALVAWQKQEREFTRVAGESRGPRVRQAELLQLNMQYRQVLRRRFEQRSCGVIPYPKIEHAEVVRRELKRRKPFSERGAGYRDLLVWLSVVDLARDDDGPVAFISHNTRDFAAEGRLHPDLQEDLKDARIPVDRIQFFPSVSKFVEGHVLPSLERPQRLMREITIGSLPGFNLRDWVLEEQEYLFTAEDLTVASTGAEHDGVHAAYLSGPELIQAEPKQVRVLNSGEILVVASAKVRAEVSVSWRHSEFERDGIHEPIDTAWTDEEVEAEVTFSLVLDGKTHAVTSYETMAVEGPACSFEMPHDRTQRLFESGSEEEKRRP